MQRCPVDTIQTIAGDIVAGAAVTVYVAGTPGLATIYSDDGVTPTANPMTSDSLGQILFYAANGRYDLVARKTGYTDIWYRDVLFEDPHQGSNSGQDSSGATATSATSSVTDTLANWMQNGPVNIARHQNTLTVGSAIGNQNSYGLSIGGDSTEGGDGVFIRGDGHGNWCIMQSLRANNPVEHNFYPNNQGSVWTGTVGTGNLTWVYGPTFASPWIGKPVYWNGTQYRVSAVTDSTHMTVQTMAGGAVAFAATATTSGHYCLTTGSGTCNVNGTTVTRVSGTPFIPIFGTDFTLKVNGSTVTPTFVNTNTYTLGASLGTLTNVTYEFWTDIFGQVSTMRLQKLWGGTEENLTIAARANNEYAIFPTISGSGSYWPVRHYNGDNGAGSLNCIMEVNPGTPASGGQGYVSLGGAAGAEAIRCIIQSGAINRIEAQGSTAGVSPAIRSRGGDTNINLGYDTKGTGSHYFTHNNFGNIGFAVLYSATSGSYLTAVSGSGEGILFPDGGTNVNIKLAPKGTGVAYTSAPFGLASYTVAGLPTGAVGQIAYATNGRKNGEGAGAGTGVLVFKDGTAWRACDTGATVAA